MKLYKFLGYSAVVVFTLCLLNQDIPASPFSTNPVRINVIPQPRQVITSAKSPACVLDDEWTVFVESTTDAPTRLAAELITKDLNEIWGLKISLLVDDKALAATEKSIILGIPKRDKKVDAIATNKAIALNPDLHPQGYKVSITPDRPGPGKILLLANTSQGLFYAAQTFRQLITKDTASQIILPPVVIDDWPLFDYRGFQIDIPNDAKTDYLKNFIHLLAYYKMNILSLGTIYLTKEQIIELAKETEKYQINLVGNISVIKPGNSHHTCSEIWCGHLGRKPLGWIDSVLKEQRFLSRIPKTTIVMNPAPGGDREQSPSGRCGANTFEQDNTNSISNYFEQIESFRREGLEQILCPRISLQGESFPDIKAIHRNIYNASQAGLRHLDNNHPIMGLMLCQPLSSFSSGLWWKPNSDIYLLETIMEPVIFTAECGWLPDRADEDKFSSNLTHSLFGITSNEVSEVIKLLSLCNEIIPSRLLLAPAEIENTGIKDVDMLLPDIFKSQIPLNIPNFYGSLEKVKLASEEALKKIASLQEKSLRSKEVLDTWHYFASQWQVFAGQFLTARNISNKYRQELYDFRYNFKLAPVLLNYESIKSDYAQLFDNHSKGFDALEEEYKKLVSQRYANPETKVAERFNVDRARWQDKKKKVSEAIVSDNFPSPEELGISPAKLPQRLVTPAIKQLDLEVGKTFTWWDRRLNYRVLVTMENTVARPAIGQELFAYPVEIQLNFTELLMESVITSSDITDMEFNLQSVQVIEYSKEGTPIAEVPHQTDKAKYFDRFNADVNLAWLIRKPIEAKTTKYFYVYFDTAKVQTPKYNVKYPYEGLSLSGTDQKSYWLKNNRFKVGLNPPLPKNNILNSSFINSWVVRDFSTGFFTHLNLIGSKKEGFGDIQGAGTAGGLSLQSQANGPLLAKFHAVSKDGDGYLFNFYENLPICEVFTDSRINEFHNSYLIPQSYLAAALKDKMSAFSGAEYLSSNYTRGKIPADKPLGNLQSNDSFWLAQRIVKGLTIASITPEKPVTHYLKTTPEDSNIAISFGVAERSPDDHRGVAGTKPLHHFILYADTTEQDTFDLLNRIKNVFTLDNMPIIQRSRAEKLSQ